MRPWVVIAGSSCCPISSARAEDKTSRSRERFDLHFDVGRAFGGMVMKVLLTIFVVAVLTPQAVAQDRSSESNRVIFMDSAPNDDAVEESNDSANVSTPGAQRSVLSKQPRLERTRFLVSGTLWSALGAFLGGLTGSIVTVGLWVVHDDLAVAGVLGTAALALSGAVVGAGRPARQTGGRCSVSHRVLGLAAGGLASTLVFGAGFSVAESMGGGPETLLVAGSAAAFTLPHLGAAYFCYNSYTPMGTPSVAKGLR